MHHTIAFCEEPAVTTEENIAGVSDDTMRVIGDDIWVGELNKVVAMFGGGHSLQTLRLVSPSLRSFFAPYVHPYVSLAADAYHLASPVDMGRNPIPLSTNEALNAKAVVSEVHADVDNFLGVSLSDGPLSPVYGDIRTMVIEADFATTQKTWCADDLTLPTDLPVGRYQIVGAMCRSNYTGIFRLVPVGGGARPGGTIDAGNDIMDMRCQRLGNMGVWTEFDQLTPPRLEICANVTGSWYSLKLDLIRVG